MGCFFVLAQPRRSLSEGDVPVGCTLLGWDWGIFIPVFLMASEVDSSKLWVAWDGVTFILSQTGCEYIHCFLQGCGPKHAHRVGDGCCLRHVPAQHQCQIYHKEMPFLLVLNDVGFYNPLVSCTC